jgi:hypothetical protein
MELTSKIKLSAFLLISAIFLFFLFAEKTNAATPVTIGQVVWVKGSVKAITEGKTRTLERRTPIYDKDTIVTNQAGTGQIVFSDNSIVALTADSTLELKEYKFDKKTPQQSKFVANLVKGGFRTVTGLIPKNNPDNYQINTPVATIGVRGTSYAVVLKGELFIKYFSGKPCVKNAQGQACLDDKDRFGKVSSADASPNKMSEDPGVFAELPDLVPASFDGLGMVGPGGSGGNITPKNNSFCIQ